MTGKYPAGIGITDFIPCHSHPWEKLVCDTPIPTADLFPTILSLTKTPYPDSLSIDGITLTSLLNDSSNHSLTRESIVLHYQYDHHSDSADAIISRVNNYFNNLTTTN